MKTFSAKNYPFFLVIIFTIIGFLNFLPNTHAQLNGGVLNGISTMENNLILAIDDNNNESNGSFRIGFNTSGYNSNGTPKTNWVEKFTLLESGYVGIGITSPKQMLHVNGDYHGKGHIWLHAHSGDGISGTAYLQARDNSGTSNIDFQFRTQSAGQVVDVLKMATNGNIGIGTTSPGAKLDVNGQIKISGGTPGAGKFLMSDANGLASWATPTFSSQWTTAGSNVYYNSGNVGIGTSSPQSKLHIEYASDLTSTSSDDTYIKLGNTGAVHTLLDYNKIQVKNDATTAGSLLINPFGGNVGIGTTSPTGKLTVSNGTIGLSVLPGYLDGTANNNWITLDIPGTQGLRVWDNFSVSGNVGIGTTSPNASLQLGNVVNNRKIVLWEDFNNDHQYYGLGINASILRYQVGSTGADHAFFAGANATASNELMRIKGNGNVGIGTSSPSAALAVAANAPNNGVLKVVSTTNTAGDQWWMGFNHGGTSTDASDRARIGVNIATGGAGRLFFTTGTNGSNQLERMRIDEKGKIGIGTSTPALKVDLRGDSSAIGLANNAAWDHLYFSHDGATAYMRAGGAENGIAFQVGTGTVGSYGGQTYTEALRIKNNGQVGIGGVLPERFEPNCALTVNGHAYIGDFGAGYNNAFINDSLFHDYYLWVERGVVSEDFAIDSVHYWDDYVFSEDYDLPSIQHLEEFVKTNSHLPNIPSEAHVKKYGYTMHNMNRSFLKTMEEFALYIISQENKITKLQEELIKQSVQIKTLLLQISHYEKLAKEIESIKILMAEQKK